MDNFVCERCRMSTLGEDGICINCGWDKYLSEYSKDRLLDDEGGEELETFDSLEELAEREYEDEEQD